MNHPHASRPQLPIRTTDQRIRALSSPVRAVHRAILRNFVDHGGPPSPATLATLVPDHDVTALLAELHATDVIQLGPDGGVLIAYPFSAAPTRHLVDIAGGARGVPAMCAVDALGISAMVGRKVTIRSEDPYRRRPVVVEVDRDAAVWAPDTATVSMPCAPVATCDCPPDSSAASCCDWIEFFADSASGQAWLAEHPECQGRLLSQDQALGLGIDIFGRLLDREA